MNGIRSANVYYFYTSASLDWQRYNVVDMSVRPSVCPTIKLFTLNNDVIKVYYVCLLLIFLLPFPFNTQVANWFKQTQEFNEFIVFFRRRWQWRRRLNALGLSTCLSVCFSVCRQNAYTKTRFSQKLSSLQLWSLLTTYRKPNTGFSKNQLLDPKIQAGGSTWRYFSAVGCNLDQFGRRM